MSSEQVEQELLPREIFIDALMVGQSRVYGYGRYYLERGTYPIVKYTRASLPEDGKLDAAARRAAEKIASKSGMKNFLAGFGDDVTTKLVDEIAAIITAELRGEKEG